MACIRSSRLCLWSSVFFVLFVFLLALHPAAADPLKAYTEKLQKDGGIVEVPQEIVDELLPLGYRYPEISRAYLLSLLLGSRPQDLIAAKPAEMDWVEYAGILFAYKNQKVLMKTISSGAKKTVEVQTEHGELLTLRSREEVLLKVRKADPRIVSHLKKRIGLLDEEVLGLLVLARLRGFPEERLEEIEEPLGQKQREEFRGALTFLDRLAGVTGQ